MSRLSPGAAAAVSASRDAGLKTRGAARPLIGIERDRRPDYRIEALLARLNRAKDGTLVLPSEYLEVVVVRA